MSDAPSEPTSPAVLEVERAGSMILDILVGLGHIDEPMLNRVNDLLLDSAAEDGAISLQEVRRVAALVIFENEEKLGPDARRAIDTEWGLLFH